MISPQGARHLAIALKGNNALQELYLGNNKIGDEGAKYIAAMLHVNSSLQVIGLDHNNISDKGARDIAYSLKRNSGIHTIYLGYNQIGDDGAEKLVDALDDNTLECNHHIETLHLRGNEVEETLHLRGNEVRYIDKHIERINNILKDPKRGVIARLKDDLISKDKEIASLKESLENSKPLVETVDLTTDQSNKRPRTEKKSLAGIVLEEKEKRLVQIKQEQVETRADLEDVREDLDIANETVTQVAVFTDRWQSKFDDLKALAEAAGVDGVAIAAIKNRT